MLEITTTAINSAARSSSVVVVFIRPRLHRIDPSPHGRERRLP